MSKARHVGIRDVSETTRADAKRVTSTLGYRPDPRGRRLASGPGQSYAADTIDAYPTWSGEHGSRPLVDQLQIAA